jgi:hypothetical protein
MNMKWNYLILNVEKGKLMRLSMAENNMARATKQVFMGTDIEIILDVFGNIGWELVAVQGDPKEEQQFYLKRPIK